MKKVHIQHGDLLLVPATIPTGGKVIGKTDGFTLLRGEGVNTHDLIGDFTVTAIGDTWYLTVGEAGASLTHKEHGPLTVAPGTYERVIEREWDYESAEARDTAD